MYYGVKFSLCAFTQGENFTLLDHIKLVETRQGEFHNYNQHAVAHLTSWPEWEWCMQQITPLLELEELSPPRSKVRMRTVLKRLHVSPEK